MNKKKIYSHTKIITVILAALLFIITPTYACIKSSDDHATEVVINKPGTEYNLNKLINAKNVIFRENKYTFVSHYNDKILVIISEADGAVSGGLTGISIKLQKPTILQREKVHTLDIISKSIPGQIIPENTSPSSYQGWNIDCTEERTVSECKFLKDETSIITYTEEGRYRAELKITGGIGPCSAQLQCSGYCVRSGGSSTCIDKERKDEIESILMHSGLIKSFSDLISAYSVVNNGPTSTDTLVEYYDEEINWEEAMGEELTWLKSRDIIRITNEDIKEISELAHVGAAGQNNRIVHAKNKQGVPEWIYYRNSIDPTLVLDKECTEYVISPGITGGVTLEPVNSKLYYIIPAAITVFLLLITALAVTFTRLHHERKKHRKEDMEKEISNVQDLKSLKEKNL